jgi:hypothetical protein
MMAKLHCYIDEPTVQGSPSFSSAETHHDAENRVLKEMDRFTAMHTCTFHRRYAEEQGFL